MNAGELRTKIRIEDRVLNPEGQMSVNGYDNTERWENIDGALDWRYCRWKDAYGSEALIADQGGIERLATCIIRYTPKLTPTCRVFLESEVRAAKAAGTEARPYEVFGIHPLEQDHHWLEFKVQRRDRSI